MQESSPHGLSEQSNEKFAALLRAFGQSINDRVSGITKGNTEEETGDNNKASLAWYALNERLTSRNVSDILLNNGEFSAIFALGLRTHGQHGVRPFTEAELTEVFFSLMHRLRDKNYKNWYKRYEAILKENNRI